MDEAGDTCPDRPASVTDTAVRRCIHLDSEDTPESTQEYTFSQVFHTTEGQKTEKPQHIACPARSVLIGQSSLGTSTTNNSGSVHGFLNNVDDCPSDSKNLRNSQKLYYQLFSFLQRPLDGSFKCEVQYFPHLDMKHHNYFLSPVF